MCIINFFKGYALHVHNVFFFLILPCPSWEIRVIVTWVRHSSSKSSAIHYYKCVQYFRVSKQWYIVDSAWVFNVRTDVDDTRLHTGAVQTP